jgi:carbon-monoxide dehydrogenase small subunit
MLITSRDIVSRFDAVDEKRIRTELAGNLCRCTGYVGIVKAVQRVMREVPTHQRLKKPEAKPNLVEPPALAAVSAVNAALTRTAAAAPPAVNPIVVESPDEKGSNRVESRFVVPLPRDQVWAIFGNTAAMAQCLPGFELTNANGNDIDGRMLIAFGPIKARFACSAAIERDDARLVGVLRGGGKDDRGGSRARGRVTYRLTDGDSPDSTVVDVTLEYQLQGPLAQFSRSGLVRDFSNRLIAGFAQNLSARLCGQAPQEAASLQVGATLWAPLRNMVERWIGR